ncbi:MAG: hypothetical protein K8R23_18490 [Chthoniobacter sp.]|nr:hypothetical protein [Chthoniobacter sp.]
MSHFLTAAGSLVDRIKINALSREIRDGRPMWIKRRRWTAKPIMAGANAFFRVVGNPVRALDDFGAWQRWEVECFLALHGDRFRAYAEGPRAVAAEEVPGVNLSQYLDTGTLTPAMLAAAAVEMRRAHARICGHFGTAWSHGDPHAGNFIYEEAGHRARLIDFEVQHHATLPAEERHADDLLVFLQDMVGRIAPELWLPSARAFLAAYERPEIVARLRGRLVAPRGIARVWWAVRTTYLAPAELARRLAELRASL